MLYPRVRHLICFSLLIQHSEKYIHRKDFFKLGFCSLAKIFSSIHLNPVIKIWVFFNELSIFIM